MVNRPKLEDKDNWKTLPFAKKQYYYIRKCRMKKKGTYYPDAEFHQKPPACKKTYLKKYYKEHKDLICERRRARYKYKKLMTELKRKVKPIT